MQASMVDRVDGRYHHLKSSLSSTADVIRQSKEMLGKPHQQQMEFHRTLKIDQHGGTKHIHLSLNCNISIQQTSSRSSFGREWAPQQLPFRPLESLHGSRTLEPSFSFGRLTPPTIGSQDQEPQPELITPERKQPREVPHIPVSSFPELKKEQQTPQTAEALRTSFGIVIPVTRPFVYNAEPSDNTNRPNQETANARDSLYRSQPATKPIHVATASTTDEILIQEEVLESPKATVEQPKNLESAYSSVESAAEKVRPVPPAVSLLETPKNFTQNKRSKSPQPSLNERYESVRERLKTDMYSSINHRSSIAKGRIGRISTNRDSYSRLSSKSRSPTAFDTTLTKSRIIDPHASSISLKPAATIACPRYRKEVERDIRAQFLNRFSFLYTQKRLSYQQLFDMYYEIRVKRLPEHRWQDHVQDFLRNRRIRTSRTKA